MTLPPRPPLGLMFAMHEPANWDVREPLYATPPSPASPAVGETEELVTYTPEQKEALGLLAHFIITGTEFEPKHAKLVLAIMASMETRLRTMSGEKP